MTNTDFKDRRILVVEDNAINQKVIAEYLLGTNAVVETASNGKEALIALNRNMYDIILMDIQMPEMDGYEATRRIRRKEATSRIPIIAITAHADKAEYDKCLLAGMNDFIPKPIDFNKLIAQIETFLSKSPTPLVIHTHANQTVDLHYVFEIIRSVPWIDFNGVFVRFKSNPELFVTLLNELYENAIQQISRIYDAVALNDWDLAQRETHTLKGVAGNMALSGLFDLCRQLERFLIRLETPPAQQITEIKNMLESIQVLLTVFQEQRKANDAENVGVPADFGDVMEQLLLLLSDSELDAITYFKNARLTLEQNIQTECLDVIGKLINNLEFEQAATMLQPFTSLSE